jgi:hypothetical protein
MRSYAVIVAGTIRGWWGWPLDAPPLRVQGVRILQARR